MRSFGREIYGGVIMLNDAFEEQINPKNQIDNFNEYTKPESPNKREKILTYENPEKFLKGTQKFLMVLEAKYFQQENRHKEKELKY